MSALGGTRCTHSSCSPELSRFSRLGAGLRPVRIEREARLPLETSRWVIRRVMLVPMNYDTILAASQKLGNCRFLLILLLCGAGIGTRLERHEEHKGFRHRTEAGSHKSSAGHRPTRGGKSPMRRRQDSKRSGSSWERSGNAQTVESTSWEEYCSRFHGRHHCTPRSQQDRGPVCGRIRPFEVWPTFLGRI